MSKLYCRISERKGAPIHVARSNDNWKVNWTYCGLMVKWGNLCIKRSRKSRVCWNCKRVLGWT